MANLKPWIPRLILISALIAALNCFSRADYNLPLYIFAYMAWGLQRSQKARIATMLLITLLFDFIWVFYWGPFWDSLSFEPGYWENGMHSFVMILSIVNLILKGVLFVFTYITENEVKKSFTFDGVKEGLMDFVS